MKNTFALFFSILILIVTVIFTLQNAQVARVRLLFWNTEASISLILFITLFIGIISAIIILLPTIFNLRATNKKLREKSLDLKPPYDPANHDEEI